MPIQTGASSSAEVLRRLRSKAIGPIALMVAGALLAATPAAADGGRATVGHLEVAPENAASGANARPDTRGAADRREPPQSARTAPSCGNG
jgi:hypothetical protein